MEPPPPYEAIPTSEHHVPVSGGSEGQPRGYAPYGAYGQYSQQPQYYRNYGSTQFQPSTGMPPTYIPVHAAQYEEVRGVDIGVQTRRYGQQHREPVTCLDNICNACTYHMNCWEDRREESQFLLRSASKAGWWMLWSLILPSISIKKAPLWFGWILFQFVAAVALTVTSAFTMSHSPDQKRTWTMIHLIACSVWLGLSILDGIATCCLIYKRVNQMYLILFRLMYTAICLYIAVISDLFDLVAYGTHNHLIFAHVFLTFAFFVIFVSVMGFIFIVNMFYKENQSGLKYLGCFLVYFVGQTIVQVLMIITLGVRIGEAKYNGMDGQVELTFHISSFLWTLFVLGLVIPASGTLMYFVTSMYWLQEYLIGICVTVLSVRSGPNAELVQNRVSWLNLNPSEEQHLRQLRETVNLDGLKQEAAHFCNKPTYYKILLPFQSPLLALLCTLYTVLLVAFPVLTLYQTQFEEPSVTTIPLSTSSGWQIFYYVSLGVYAVANLHPLAVGLFWIAAFVVFSAIIVLTLRAFMRRISRTYANEACAEFCIGCFSASSTIG